MLGSPPKHESFQTNIGYSGSFASRAGGMQSFQHGQPGTRLPPGTAAPSYVPGPSSAGASMQPQMGGCSTQLPPGLANGRNASFAGSSVASQVGSSFGAQCPIFQMAP